MSKALRNMFKLKNLPAVLLILGAGFFLAFRTFGIGGGNPPTKYEKILHNVGEMLAEIHYSPKKIDDNFSKEIFKKFLAEKIDDQKNILLLSDIKQLKKNKNGIDDEIQGGNVRLVPAVSELYKKRVLEIERIFTKVLAKPSNLTKDD